LGLAFIITSKRDISNQLLQRGIQYKKLLNSISEHDKNEQGSISAALSNWVGPAGQISNQYLEDLIEIQRLKYIIKGKYST
jgi:hypothetical protein